MRNKGITILLIIMNIILIAILCSFIRINGSIIKEKQIIKEMSESTQITDLNNQINALNTEHTEYINYIQTCKASIATALTNEGVETSNETTLEIMAENISKIFTERTKLDNDVAATVDNITKGKQAYVNGKLITGTGADSNRGITKKIAETSYSLHWYYGETKTTNITIPSSQDVIYIVVSTSGYAAGSTANWRIKSVTSNNANSDISILFNKSVTGPYAHTGFGLIKVSNVEANNVITIKHGGYQYEGTYLIGVFA